MTPNDPFSPRDIVLGDGSVGRVRPLVPTDRDALVAGFNSLSPESRIRRFFFNKRAFSERELHLLTHPDGIDHLAFVLELPVDDGPGLLPIAVARCFRHKQDRSLAEAAFVTVEDYQGIGIGTALAYALAAAAWSVGIRRWFAALFSDHRTTRNLLNRVGFLGEETAISSGVVDIVCHLHPPRPDDPRNPMQPALHPE